MDFDSRTSGNVTRPSLLLRLRDASDELAWSEFSTVYEPVIYRMVRRRGVQDADAREIVQEVLFSVSAAVDRFDANGSGSFRGWLSRITRNATIDRLRTIQSRRETIGGMIAGTPQYMSPEQARGEPVDVRSDLFSMGSLLYALATGRPPFRAETPLAILRKITETRPKPITEINERMPAWFDMLVMQFMQRELCRRLGSADEAVTLLREAHSHVCNPSLHPLPRTLKDHRSRRMFGWSIAVMCVVVVVLLGVAWITHKPTTGQTQVTRPVASVGPENVSSAVAGSVSDLSSTEDWHAVGIDRELQSIKQTLDELSRELGAAQ